MYLVKELIATARDKGRGWVSYVWENPETGEQQAKRAYVIQPNGKIQARRQILWVVTLNPTPRPGATVVVPVKGADDGDLQRLAATIQIVAQTVASLATVWALLRP